MVSLYAGSDGQYYTDWQVSWQFESDQWKPCMWDTNEGWEVVDNGEDLVWLVPVSPAELPEWAEIRPTQPGPGAEVVDRREA